SRQERFFSTNNTYTNVAANLGYTTLPASVPGSGTTTYEISVSSATAGAYSLLATPKTDQLKDSCGSYSINQLGVQANTFSGAGLSPALSADCWR
ncbi:MAG: type IV pilin protein, partial [Burkholderiaceae bacterium]